MDVVSNRHLVSTQANMVFGGSTVAVNPRSAMLGVSGQHRLAGGVRSALTQGVDARYADPQAHVAVRGGPWRGWIGGRCPWNRNVSIEGSARWLRRLCHNSPTSQRKKPHWHLYLVAPVELDKPPC